MKPAPLWRATLAEFIGTGALVALVVGSGIMAASLSPDDVGIQLLENSTATGLGLCVLIILLGPVSGAHLNPVVTGVMVLLGRTSWARAGAYVVAQVIGAIGGSVLANLMFDLGPVAASTTVRSGTPLLLAEVVATTGLIVVILGLLWQQRDNWIAPMVGAYIAAAYWFTASTSFANPAVTIGRAFTDTFAGIAPGSVPAYVVAQLIGGAVGLVLASLVFAGRLVTAGKEPGAGELATAEATDRTPQLPDPTPA